MTITLDSIGMLDALIRDGLDECFVMNDPADGYYVDDEGVHTLAVAIYLALR